MRYMVTTSMSGPKDSSQDVIQVSESEVEINFSTFFFRCWQYFIWKAFLFSLTCIMEHAGKDKEERLTKLFRYLYNNKVKFTKQKKNDEEFYYADVEGTRSQFTQSQLKTIQDKHDIPISTKISFAIVEHLRSFISGSEPYPRLIAVEEAHKDWTTFWERVVSSIWYESSIQHEVDEAVKDGVVTGTGFVHVRPNQFYKESTFNVVAEFVSWHNVYVDPSSKKADFSDADIICVARAIPALKAEKEFGITISEDDLDMSEIDPSTPEGEQHFGTMDLGFWSAFSGDDDRKRTKQVWVKEFYLKEIVTEYVSVEGYISLTPPVPTSIPNPQKMELMEYRQMLMEQIEQMPIGQDPQSQEMQQQMQPIADELEQVEQAIGSLPDYVPAFRMELENGSMVHTENYDIRQKKRIQKVLQVHKRIVKTEWTPTDEFPVIPFHFTHFKAPERTFGVIHYIKDIVKAVNKLWALLIYDMQLKSSMRIVAPEGSIQNMGAWESKFSIPGSVNLYTPDPTLHNNGQPEVVVPSDTPSQVPALISMLVNLAEYVTGIFGVMQGNQEGAPSTYGTTQALQSFGTNRVKLFARQLEGSLNMLVYNIVVYAQRYAPQDKLAVLLDPEKHQDIGAILAAGNDAKYKVRTTITKNLPTSRQMAANMFMILAGQVADPALQQLLAREGIKFLDVLETDKMSDKMDLVQELQGQIAQLEEQAKESENKMKMMSNNVAQKEAAMELEKAKGDIKAHKAKTEAEIDTQQELGNNV